MNTNTLYKIDRVLTELKKISHSLHRLAENNCNYGLTPKQEKREANLIKKADELAKELGLRVYHQGDPRGCILYLIEPHLKSEGKRNGHTEYTRGFAVSY